MADKPKRVLTEAQRLAFLKGREKRMANIEKKRLEKLEVEEAMKKPIEPLQVAEETKPTTTPPDAALPKLTSPPPSPPKLKIHKRTRQLPLEERVASRVVEELSKQQQQKTPSEEPPAKKKRTYIRKVKSEASIPENKPVVSSTPIQNFSWM